MLGVSYGAIYVATAISAVVGTLLIGLLSNLPLAQASGMGLNAYFVYTVCVGLGLSYANALVLVLFDGIIFVLLTVTGLRKIIFDSIPHEVKVAISAGIGLFIAFIGLQNAGLVVNDASTCVNLHSFNVFTGEQTWATILPHAHHPDRRVRHRRHDQEEGPRRGAVGHSGRCRAVLLPSA